MGVIFTIKQNDISGKLLSVSSDFLKDRKQTVILNRQVSSWKSVNTGVPQGSILGPLLFLVYINDLADGLWSNIKLFADDTSLFLVTSDVQLNKDLHQINKWAFQQKMNLNLDLSKQVQEMIFIKKLRAFLILHYVLVTALSRKPYVKNTLTYFLMLN